jgi:uracil-DNA glycosylase
MNEHERLIKRFSGILDDAIDFMRTGFSSRGPAGSPGPGPDADDAGPEPQGTSSPRPAISKDQTKNLFEAVVREVLVCTKCPLHKGRLNAVPGKGSIEADIVFIGEGPGEMEDIKGEPFVGRAGQLLTKMLAAIELTRDEVYITNIVKCRPPQNRAPLPEESSACFPYLEKQLELIDPKIICCLGGPSAQLILSTNQGITKLRGTVHRYRGTPVVPTYHPAAVLRFPDKYKRDVWNDLKMLRDFARDLQSH